MQRSLIKVSLPTAALLDYAALHQGYMLFSRELAIQSVETTNEPPY